MLIIFDYIWYRELGILFRNINPERHWIFTNAFSLESQYEKDNTASDFLCTLLINDLWVYAYEVLILNSRPTSGTGKNRFIINLFWRSGQFYIYDKCKIWEFVMLYSYIYILNKTSNLWHGITTILFLSHFSNTLI